MQIEEIEQQRAVIARFDHELETRNGSYTALQNQLSSVIIERDRAMAEISRLRSIETEFQKELEALNPLETAIAETTLERDQMREECGKIRHQNAFLAEKVCFIITLNSFFFNLK